MPLALSPIRLVDHYPLVSDEDQMAADFLGFLSNLVKIFPSLSTRPLYLTGESYAGTYIVSPTLILDLSFLTTIPNVNSHT